MTISRYMPQAQTIARIIPQTLSQRGLEPVITRFMLTETRQGEAWMFAVLDEQRVQRLEPYITPETLHQISTALHGLPVLVSNSTGIRYAILLSRRPHLPTNLPFPGWRRSILQIGQSAHGTPISVEWESLGHILVAGMTGAGKSNLLRLLVHQAQAENIQLLLADPDGRSFPYMAGHSSLLEPLGSTLEGCAQVITAALNEMQSRATLFTGLPGSHDTLDTYNAAAKQAGQIILPRLLVVVDEFNGLVQASGGPRGALAQQLTRLAWGGRKFGIQIVLAGQTFEKDIVGPVRDQMTTRICYRVATPSIARIVLGEGGAERLKAPGRAISNRWGLLQTYRAPEIEVHTGDGLSPAERRLVDRLQAENDGRMTYEALGRLGYSRRSAVQLRRDWEQRGLAVRRPELDNALCLADFLNKPV